MFEIDTDVNSNAVLTEYIYTMIKHLIKHLLWFSRGQMIQLLSSLCSAARVYNHENIHETRSL